MGISSPISFASILLSTFLISILTPVFGDSPDTLGCCRDAGLSTACAEYFCDVSKPPQGGALSDRLLEFESKLRECNHNLPVISRCMANGRNNTNCCMTASDRDQSQCFNMCDGTSFEENEWKDSQGFKSCINNNIEFIYECYADGYSNSPSQPRNVAVNVIGPKRARVTWDSPATNAHVISSYAITVKSNMAHDNVITMSTTGNAIELPKLKPDMKYFLTVVAVAGDGKHMSAPSPPTVFLTVGVKPTLKPYMEVVETALKSDKTMVCRVEVPGWQHKHVQVLWEKKNAVTGDFEVLQNTENAAKYSLTAYVAAFHRQPRAYVSALRINDIALADFGDYQCTANNAFGKGIGSVKLARVTPGQVPPAPPNTTECCHRSGVHADCVASCHEDSSMELPNERCVLDATKILGCSLAGNDRGACCLRRRVPSHCLSFCGAAEEQSTNVITQFACLQHTNEIFSCLLEANRDLPEAPKAVHVAAQTSNVAIVRWQAAARADQYHVYYRATQSKQHRDWQLKTVTSTDVELHQLVEDTVTELIVVASNGAGRSGSSRTLHIYTGNAPQPMPFNSDDAADRSRARRHRHGHATGRLMEEHFGQA